MTSAADKTAAKIFPIPANVPARPACGTCRGPDGLVRAEFRVEHRDASGYLVKTTWACKACAASHS